MTDPVDRQRQVAELRAALAAGWRLYRDWQKIKARYQDRDLADQVPRPIVYIDLGVLCGYISQLEEILHAAGLRLAPIDDATTDTILEHILRE